MALTDKGWDRANVRPYRRSEDGVLSTTLNKRPQCAVLASATVSPPFAIYNTISYGDARLHQLAHVVVIRMQFVVGAIERAAASNHSDLRRFQRRCLRTIFFECLRRLPRAAANVTGPPTAQRQQAHKDCYSYCSDRQAVRRYCTV